MIISPTFKNPVSGNVLQTSWPQVEQNKTCFFYQHWCLQANREIVNKCRTVRVKTNKIKELQRELDIHSCICNWTVFHKEPSINDVTHHLIFVLAPQNHWYLLPPMAVASFMDGPLAIVTVNKQKLRLIQYKLAVVVIGSHVYWASPI